MITQIKTENLKDVSLFIGTPMYGGQCYGAYAKSHLDLTQMCNKHGIKINQYFLFNESLIQRARNYVVDEFLRSGYTHLMFIDSDIGFNPKDVIMMLYMQSQEPEKYDIMTGPYPKKTIAWEKVSATAKSGLSDENPFNLAYYAADFVFNPAKKEFRLDEPVEVSEAGTGFMLIPKSVFEKYDEAYPEYKYIPDHTRTANFDGSREIMAYFDCEIDPDTKRYLSEDYFFCRNARKAGIKLHMCPWMMLNHVGTYTYRGSMAAIAAIGTSQTASKESNEKYYKQKQSPGTQKKFTKTKKPGTIRK